MSDEAPVRRSFRLKDKPSPEYAYRNYLKVAIEHAELAPKKDYIPPAVIETNKKYDDIFSSVVANAFLMDVQKTPDEFYAEKRAQKRQNSGSEVESGGDSDDTDDVEILEDSDDVTEVVELESRLSEIQKRLKIVKKADSPKRKRKNKKKKMQEKEEQKSEKIQEKSEKIVENPPKMTTQKSVDLEIIPIPMKKFPCSCGTEFEKHDDCHKHIYEEHDDDEVNADCMQCGHRLDEIRSNHLCPVCGKFAAKLEEHLILHYRNCTSENAVMECRFCTRQFKTVKEVVMHEQQKHIAKPLRKLTQIYKCNECSVTFNIQETLTCHYSIHIDLNVLSDQIDELQRKVDAEKEECPFCRVNMSSRKSFRAHILKHHWIACKSLSKMTNLNELMETKSDLEIKKEINEMTKNAFSDVKQEEEDDDDVIEIEQIKEIKKEVKEEIHDDGYPAC